MAGFKNKPGLILLLVVPSSVFGMTPSISALDTMWVLLATFLGFIMVFVITVTFLAFRVIDTVIGLRVSENEEVLGLDIGEHGMESYAGFQIFTVE